MVFSPIVTLDDGEKNTISPSCALNKRAVNGGCLTVIYRTHASRTKHCALYGNVHHLTHNFLNLGNSHSVRLPATA